MDIEFKVPQNPNSIIMVAGVGGGGGNAVNHMYSLGVADVSFMVINTDKQALDRSAIPTKILLGNGLGAGNNPEKGKIAANESEDAIREALTVNDTKMLFVTAGMGGGTGTGASPVVARIAKEMGILTVGIVSIPYKGEGPKRVAQAVAGIEALIPCVDSLIVINNEHIAQIHGKLGIKEAHAKADDILAMAAKSIADILTSNMDVNVDFADVTTIMKEDATNPRLGKIALMGSAVGDAEGEGRAMKIAEEAVNSPLLHHNDIRGAKKVLLNITWGESEVSYDETFQVMDFIQQRSGLTNDEASNQTDVIWGAGYDPTLGNNIRITVVATGFDVQDIPAISDSYSGVLRGSKPKSTAPKAPQREVVSFDDVDSAAVAKKPVEASDDNWTVVTHQKEGDQQPASTNSDGQLRPVRIEVSADRVSRPAMETTAEPMKVTPALDLQSTNTMVDIDDKTMDQPAYLRRRVSLYTVPRDASSKRESLDAGAPATEVAPSISLFDQ